MAKLMHRFVVPLAAFAALIAPSGLGAQVPTNNSYATIGPAFTTADLERPSPTGKARASGLSIQGEAGLVLAGFLADARFATGSLNYEDADSSVTLVEAELMLGYRPLRWLALEFGPHFRSVKTPLATDDWLFWEGRVWFGATLLQRIAYSYLEGWVILAGSAEGRSFDNGFGIEGGLVLKTTTLPVWLKTGYRMDRATFDSLGSADTVQQLVFLLGIDFSL